MDTGHSSSVLHRKDYGQAGFKPWLCHSLLCDLALGLLSLSFSFAICQGGTAATFYDYGEDENEMTYQVPCTGSASCLEVTVVSFLHPLPLNSTPRDRCVRVCENTAFSLHSDNAGTLTGLRRQERSGSGQQGS